MEKNPNCSFRNSSPFINYMYKCINNETGAREYAREYAAKIDLHSATIR